MIKIYYYIHIVRCQKGAVILGGLVIMGLGCCNGPALRGPVPDPITKDQAVDLYNANVEAVPDFSARIEEWEVQFFEEDKKHHYKEGGGKVYCQLPEPPAKFANFYMRALERTFGSAALEVGSNEKEFWMKSKPGKWSYWDTHDNAARHEASNFLIINPQAILDLIGLRRIPVEELAWPYLNYKIWPEQNFIEYALPQERGWREIIVDRRSNLPEQINFYDANGLRIIESRLSNYQSLGQAMLPGDIFLTAPADDTYFRLKLRRFIIPETISPRLFTLPADIDSIKDKP